MHKYKELKVWQKAVQLSTEVYRLRAVLPVEEKYGLTAQMRRSVVSIASNIAEGAGRTSTKEFRHFLAIASGSCYELETQIIIANNIELFEDMEAKRLLEVLSEIMKMIFVLSKSIS